MKILAFLIVCSASYALATVVMNYEAKEKILTDQPNFKKMAAAWPSHWEKLSEIDSPRRFIAWYSPKEPREEMDFCIKHFEKLDYKADGVYRSQYNDCLFWVQMDRIQVTLTFKPDEEGNVGSEITALINPHHPKEGKNK